MGHPWEYQLNLDLSGISWIFMDTNGYVWWTRRIECEYNGNIMGYQWGYYHIIGIRGRSLFSLESLLHKREWMGYSCHAAINGVLMGCTGWFIPLSKWVITLVINGISGVSPLITGVITHLLSGMNHQVIPFLLWILFDFVKNLFIQEKVPICLYGAAVAHRGTYSVLSSLLGISMDFIDINGI